LCRFTLAAEVDPSKEYPICTFSCEILDLN